MRLAGILTGGIVVLILGAVVCIPQHSFSLAMTYTSVDHDQLSFHSIPPPVEEANQAVNQYQPIERPT